MTGTLSVKSKEYTVNSLHWLPNISFVCFENMVVHQYSISQLQLMIFFILSTGLLSSVLILFKEKLHVPLIYSGKWGVSNHWVISMAKNNVKKVKTSCCFATSLSKAASLGRYLIYEFPTKVVTPWMWQNLLVFCQDILRVWHLKTALIY